MLVQKLQILCTLMWISRWSRPKTHCVGCNLTWDDGTDGITLCVDCHEVRGATEVATDWLGVSAVLASNILVLSCERCLLASCRLVWFTRARQMSSSISFRADSPNALLVTCGSTDDQPSSWTKNGCSTGASIVKVLWSYGGAHSFRGIRFIDYVGGSIDWN